MAIIVAVGVVDESIECPPKLLQGGLKVWIVGVGRNRSSRFCMTHPTIVLGIPLIERNALVLQMFAVTSGLVKKVEALIILPVLRQQLRPA